MIKKTALFFLLGGLFLAAPVLGQDVNFGGYLSFDYSHGEEKSLYSKGRIGNLEGGLVAAGFLIPRFEYALELSFRPGSELTMEQAWLGYAASEAFSVRFGLIPVAFGRFNLLNRPHSATFVQPPLNASALLPHRWKEIGIEASGRFAGIEFSFYLGNGIAEAQDLSGGQQFGDNNADKGRGFRIGAPLGDNLSVGYSRYWGKYDRENERTLKMQALDAGWITEGFQLVYERIWTDMENPEEFAQGEARGDYFLGVLAIGRLQPFFSYQRLNYSDPFHGPLFAGTLLPGNGILLEKSRLTAGLIYSPSESVFFKAEYDFNREEGEERKDNLFTIQLALRF